MIYINDTKDEFSEYFIQSVQRFTKKEGKPKGIGVSLNKSLCEISIHYNLNNKINKEDKSIDQFEFKRYDITKYQIGQVGIKANPKGQGHVDLWKKIRNVTRHIELPTVLYHIEDIDQFDIPVEMETEIFGRAVIKYFRDENMDYHTSLCKGYTNKPLDEIKDELKDHWSEEIKQEQLRNASFFGSLNKEQLEFLNDYVLRIIDNTTFNVMRALDEKTGYEGSPFSVEVNGIKATDLNLIGNGNLSGEYLDWIDRFSMYKEFQT